METASRADSVPVSSQGRICSRRFLASDHVQHGPPAKKFCHPERSEGSRILWLRRPIHGILHRCAVQNDRWIVKCCTHRTGLRHCFGRLAGRGLAPAAFLASDHVQHRPHAKKFCHPERSEGSRILWLRRPIHGILHRCAVQNDRWIVKCCTQDGGCGIEHPPVRHTLRPCFVPPEQDFRKPRKFCFFC